MDQVAVLFFFPLEKKKKRKEKLMVYKIPQD